MSESADNSSWSPGSSAPDKQKIQKNNNRKIQKNPKKNRVVDKLMREVRSKIQPIWTSEQASAKKTNRVKTVCEQ